VEVSLVTGTLKVHMDNTPEEAAPQVFKVKEVKLLKDGFTKKISKEEAEDLKNLE